MQRTGATSRRQGAYLLFEPVRFPRNGLGLLRIVDNHRVELGKHSQRRDILYREKRGAHLKRLGHIGKGFAAPDLRIDSKQD